MSPDRTLSRRLRHPDEDIYALQDVRVEATPTRRLLSYRRHPRVHQEDQQAPCSAWINQKIPNKGAVIHRRRHRVWNPRQVEGGIVTIFSRRPHVQRTIITCPSLFLAVFTRRPRCIFSLFHCLVIYTQPYTTRCNMHSPYSLGKTLYNRLDIFVFAS
jgi:hypothetical protein